jgi:hypothetical protein
VSSSPPLVIVRDNDRYISDVVAIERGGALRI